MDPTLGPKRRAVPKGTFGTWAGSASRRDPSSLSASGTLKEKHRAASTSQCLIMGVDLLRDEPFIEGSPVRVSKLGNVPFLAKEVLFQIIKPTGVLSDSDTFIDYVHYQCNRTCLFQGLKLDIPFAGINVIIEIVKLTKYDLGKEIDLSFLSLEESFYYANEATSWVLKDNNVEILDKKPKLIGGYDTVVKTLKSYISYTFDGRRKNVGSQSCFGLLLYGCPGSGKTYLAEAIAEQAGAHVVSVKNSRMVGNSPKEVDTYLKRVFEEASQKAPSILLLDNIEIYCPAKGSESERRTAATVVSLFDSLRDARVVIIATSSKPDTIDPSIQRPGRLGIEIEVEPPSPDDRFEILKTQTTNDVLYDTLFEISKHTHGFVAADLVMLWSKACAMASADGSEVHPDALWWALKQVRPSAVKQFSVQVPNVQWSDIGGQDELKLKLRQAVEWPLKFPKSFETLGITPPCGVLMYGPPGCSKTMIAKALATESRLNFLSVKGSDIFSKWVGDSEKAVRDLFKKARASAPSIIFLDEVDAIGVERDSKGGQSGGAAVSERVLSQILTEMDGVTPLENVIIVAATNRPDRIDKALLRPGRLDRIIYVPLPDFLTRSQIFKIKLSKMPCDSSVDIPTLAGLTEGYSGAEVVAVCREAAMTALQESMDAKELRNDHFMSALKTVTPRTPKSLLDLYESYSRHAQ